MVVVVKALTVPEKTGAMDTMLVQYPGAYAANDAIDKDRKVIAKEVWAQVRNEQEIRKAAVLKLPEISNSEQLTGARKHECTNLLY